MPLMPPCLQVLKAYPRLLLISTFVVLLSTETRLYVGMSHSVPGRLFFATLFGEIKRGCLVAIQGKDSFSHITLIKYIVGLPGDIVEVQGSFVVINGFYFKCCDEQESITPRVIPPGQCFVAGWSVDSCDSRYRQVSLLPLSQCKGVVRLVCF